MMKYWETFYGRHTALNISCREEKQTSPSGYLLICLKVVARIEDGKTLIKLLIASVLITIDFRYLGPRDS